LFSHVRRRDAWLCGLGEKWPSQPARSEKSGAQVETQGNHGETREQTNTAKQRYQCEGLSISPRFGSFAHKNVCNKRIHGNLLIGIGSMLIGHRFKRLSRDKKNGFSGIAELFHRNPASAPPLASRPAG
jgi:hypothetical protein